MKNAVIGIVVGWVVLASAGCGSGKEEPGAARDNLVVPERAGMFTEATQFYGPLVVTAGEYFVQSKTRPWSGYWYPLKDDLLVKGSARNGGKSTLEKVDMFAKLFLGKTISSVNEEKKERLYNPMAESWEGRCGAWAMAAVLEPEPVLPASGVKIPGSDLTFFTRDVKALIIKSYETVDNSVFNRFGQLNEGSPSDDYQDLYPDQFHRVMTAELFEKGQPFLMDDTAGPEVWNTPVWAALTTLTQDESDPHVMHVFTRVKGSQSIKISPDYAGLSNDTTYQYTYDLIGLPQGDGSLLVKYGKWTGDSFRDHPDFVLSAPARGTKIRHASLNSEVSPEIVDAILAKTGIRR